VGIWLIFLAKTVVLVKSFTFGYIWKIILVDSFTTNEQQMICDFLKVCKEQVRLEIS
jgi:hypothetical protein